MDFTTTARVNTTGGFTTGTHDALIAQLISVVSAELQGPRHMDRLVEVTERTELFELDGVQRSFELRAFPLASVAEVEVLDANGDAIDATDFTLHERDGVVEFAYAPRPDIGAAGATNGRLSIKYTGGVATDVDGLLADPEFAALVFAVDLLVVQLVKNRDQLGGTTEVAIAGSRMAIMDPTRIPRRVRDIIGSLRR